MIICEPLLEHIDLAPDNIGQWGEQVVSGGESSNQARPCNFDWEMELRNVCEKEKVSSRFKQTSANFIKDGKHYNIKCPLQHSLVQRRG